MKQWIKWIVCFSFFCLLMQPVMADASFRSVEKVSGSAAVVKTNPTMQSASWLTLTRGDYVTVLNRTGEWSSVLINGRQGYVKTNFLQPAISTIRHASSKGGVIVKQMPNTMSPTTAVLQYGMILQHYQSVGNGWAFVQYGNVTGYVNERFIGVPKAVKRYASIDLDVRNIASSSGQAIGVMMKGTAVDVYSTIAGWAYVKANGVEGYVVAAQLQSTKPTVSAADKIIGYYDGLVPKNLKQNIRYEYYYGSNEDFSYAYFFQAQYTMESQLPKHTLVLKGDTALPVDRYEETKTGFTYTGLGSWDALPVQVDYPLKKGQTKTYTVNGRTLTSKVVAVKEPYATFAKVGNLTNAVIIQVKDGQDEGLFVFELNKGLVATKLDLQSKNYVGTLQILGQ